MALHTRNGRRVVYHCQRCEYHWAPRLLECPNICPRCKSRDWQTARTTRQGLRATPPRRPPDARVPKPRVRIVMLKVRGVACRQCGYQWVPRTATIRACPSCRSVRFDHPKKQSA
jgi:predicted Zn-ribbon and HTH transcriptional regulator